MCERIGSEVSKALCLVLDSTSDALLKRAGEIGTSVQLAVPYLNVSCPPCVALKQMESSNLPKGSTNQLPFLRSLYASDVGGGQVENESRP